MKFMRLSLAASAAFSVVAMAQTAPTTPVQATIAPEPVAPIVAAKVEAPTAGTAILPANTDLLLRLDEEVNSKQVKVGHKFKLTLIQDVMLGTYVVIPRGAIASGEVTYRTGKGAFGKSAKMEIDIRTLEFGGRSIPLSGHYRQEGTGNTGATVGAAVAVGVFSAFVTGRSAIFAQGREFRASTREALQVTLPI